MSLVSLSSLGPEGRCACRQAQPLTLGRLAERVELLAIQMDESDRALRRDLESFRIATQRELEASSAARSLVLVALIALVLHLLSSWWIAAPARRSSEEVSTLELE